MSLARGSEFPRPNTRTADVSKILHNHQNKQIQLREEVKVRSVKYVNVELC